MRSFTTPLLLSLAIATSATEENQCDLVSDVVDVLHAAPYAPELCSSLLQISTATVYSTTVVSTTETATAEATETETTTETITTEETTIVGTVTATADAVWVTSTQ